MNLVIKYLGSTKRVQEESLLWYDVMTDLCGSNIATAFNQLSDS